MEKILILILILAIAVLGPGCGQVSNQAPDNSGGETSDYAEDAGTDWFDDTVPQNIRDAVRDAVTEEWTDTFGAYYQVLGFEAETISYANIENQAEVKFWMTMITQNFYKDPDTVAYIKEAKESGSVHYQQLYDEYNMPKESNFNLMATMTLDASGEVELGTLQLYSDVSPHGGEYKPVKADDFIIKE